jgi:hypothetical protein
VNVPSWSDTRTLDEFFIRGRNMWPDLGEIEKLPFDRSKVPDDVVRFLRSTALNEHGIVHYVQQYFRAYGDDYKLGLWASMWGGEEYLHSIVLRTILQGLGEEISAGEYSGLENSDYGESYDAYLARKREGYRMDARMQQLIYGVMQEYAAKIAYLSVADVAGDPNVDALLRRVAKDETRHCRLCLEALAENVTDEVRAEIWPQFNALFKDHQMPQEHIRMFAEYDMGTDLYVKFWTPAYRSDLLMYLTHYFRQFRDPAWLEKRAAAGRVDSAAQAAAQPS